MHRLMYFIFAVLLTAIALPLQAATDDPEIGGKTLKKWLIEAQSADPAVREHAIRMVVNFGKDAEKAVPMLIANITNNDSTVSTNAIVALRSVGLKKEDDLKKAVVALEKTLKTGSSTARLQSAMALGQIGPKAKSAVPTLVGYTIKYTFSWEMRKAGAFALGHVAFDDKGPDASAVAGLCILVQKDPCAQVRLEGVMSLGTLAAHRAPGEVERVKNVLEKYGVKDPDPVVKIWSHALLVQTPNVKPALHVKVILGYMQAAKSDSHVRMAAAQALGVLGEAAKPVIGDLIAALKDDDDGVAGMAAVSLGSLRAELVPNDVTAVTKLLEDAKQTPQTRIHAIQTLIMVGKNAAGHVPRLIEALEDKNPLVASASGSALVQLKEHLKEADVTAISKNLAHKDAAVRCRSAQVLGGLGDAGKKYKDDIYLLLQDKDSDVVVCVISLLAGIDKTAPKFREAVTKLKLHTNEAVKQAATQALEVIDMNR